MKKQVKKAKNKFVMILIVATMSLLSSIEVNASTYTTNNNLFENSYTNNLIDMAQTQIKNINNMKYMIIQIDNNYYLIASKEATINNNKVTMNNTSIIKATRVQENYNYYYNYETTTESTTDVNVNNIVISNIGINRAVASSRFDNYKQNMYVKNIGIFILGLVFAIFLTKERNY